MPSLQTCVEMTQGLDDLYKFKAHSRWVILRREDECYALLDPWTLDLFYLSPIQTAVLAAFHKHKDTAAALNSVFKDNLLVGEVFSAAELFIAGCRERKWI